MKHKYVDLIFLLPVLMNVVRVEQKAIISFDAISNKEITFRTDCVVAIVVVEFCLLVFVLLKYHRIRQSREKLLVQLQKQSKVNENQVESQMEEIRLLQQKNNETFTEIIQLAKDNSAEFFTRFHELYPDVVGGILKIDPKFRVSELTLCAYIFLGFTTKDIAFYTFKSVNTVRNRKYNLRKKLDIPTEESMELWLRELHTKD